MFAHREFNGEILIEELEQLRDAQVRQKQLDDCANVLRSLSGMRVSAAQRRVQQIADGRFQSQPALANLLVRLSSKLRNESDVAALVLHFRRLALASALIGAIRRGSDRVVAG